MTTPKPTGHRAHDKTPKFITDKRTGNLVVVYYPDPTSDRRKFLSTRTSDPLAAEAYWEAHRDRIGAVRRGHEHLATREQGAFTVVEAPDVLLGDHRSHDRKTPLPRRRRHKDQG